MFDLPSSSRGLAALVRHRLFQFGAIGGALFVMAPARSDGHTLTIPAARIDAMVRLEASRQAPPRSEEALRRDVIVRLIEDELLIHEARRLGLDQDDHILRQRLVQKALFLAEDMGGRAAPPARPTCASSTPRTGLNTPRNASLIPTSLRGSALR